METSTEPTHRRLDYLVPTMDSYVRFIKFTDKLNQMKMQAEIDVATATESNA